MSQMNLFVDALFTRHRWILHVFFWIGVLLFYVVFFGRKNENYLMTFFFTGLLMPVTIVTTYFLNYWLVPKFLMKDRFWLFSLYFVYTLIASVFFETVISMATFIVMAKVQIKNMSPASVDIFFLLASLLVVVFFGVAIKMLLHWRKSKEDYQKLMRDKVEAELKFLKAQLNPHFLFNTLNNLYFLSSEKSDKTPQAILALSELLDYVLHDTKLDFVLLDKELKQVRNYIELESLRYDDRLQLDWRVSGNSDRLTIAPMLLITLVDNAFKHGVMTSVGIAWIEISIDCHPKRISIQLKNSHVKKEQSSGEGIGLENLKSQLNLLYSNRHQLVIENNASVFSVNLELYET